MSQMRYWIARLKPIAHPTVGLSLLCIGMTGVFVWTAYQYPDVFSFVSSETNAEDAENAAIGADIDSLSLLTQSTGDGVLLSNSAPGNPTNPNLNPLGDPKALGTAATNQTANQTASLNGQGFPLLGGGPLNLLGLTGNNSGGNSLGFNLPARSDVSSANAGSANANSANSSSRPTAAALQSFTLQSDPSLQSTSPPTTWTQFPQTPIEGTTALPANALKNLQNNGLPSNSWTAPTQGTTGLPTNTPIAPSSNNAYTQLTAPNGFSSDPGVAAPASSVGIPIAPIASPNPVGISAPVMPNALPNSESGVAPIQPEQVFTAPRPLPGRAIGGGNVNTFSNP